MNNQDKIKFLSQYINAGKEYDEILSSYEFFKHKITSLQASIITDMPMNQSYLTDKIGNHVAKLEQIEKIIDEKLHKIEQLRIDVENVIGRVDDSLLRRVLTLKYMDERKLTWEKICVEINYSWSQTHRLHSRALNQVKV